MKKQTRAELEEALRIANAERDAWQLVHIFKKPDFELRVEGGDWIERWSLHATHRASGPVLVVTPSGGSWPIARYLMHVPVQIDPYRESARRRCQTFATDFVAKGTETADALEIRSMNEVRSAIFNMAPPHKDRREDAIATALESRCTCERPCASAEQHICRVSQALNVHKATCEFCRSQR